jgi:hypothetical protein
MGEGVGAIASAGLYYPISHEIAEHGGVSSEFVTLCQMESLRDMAGCEEKPADCGVTSRPLSLGEDNDLVGT